jgi:glycosyltransferase involved in cell wall biosynthesis
MISLLVATLGRVDELNRLLASLENQDAGFEVLVVDQNPDDRLAPVLAAHSRLAARHLRSERGLSRARNVGLRAAQGDLIAIPDDDCWYPAGLLARVEEWFRQNRAHCREPTFRPAVSGERLPLHQGERLAVCCFHRPVPAPLRNACGGRF